LELNAALKGRSSTVVSAWFVRGLTAAFVFGALFAAPKRRSFHLGNQRGKSTLEINVGNRRWKIDIHEFQIKEW
jgi:hypothetical protein